jgi:signal transduction histidine kinase
MFPVAVYESVFKAAPIGGYLLSITPEVTILDVNDSFLQTIGRSRGDLLGKSLFEVFSANPGDPGDSGIDALRQSIAQAVATGKVQFMPCQRFPISRIEPDGQVVFEERFWSATNTPIYDALGNMASIYHATIDITKQVHFEDALRSSEKHALESAREAQKERARLQVIVDTIPTGLIIMDESGQLVVENGEWIKIWGGSARTEHGIDYDKYIGFRPATGERIAPEEWPCAVSFYKGIELHDVVLDIVRFDGTRGTIVVSSAPILDESRRIVGAVAANMDITAQRTAQIQLLDADRRKDEFLAMLAHELRNPLAPIGAAAEILSLTAKEERVKKTSQVISRQVRHMTSLIDDLLDVSRVTRGLVQLESCQIDIRMVANQAVEQVTPLIHARRHHLTIQLTPETAMVEGDPKRLVQILVNILHNAAKYTPEGGSILLQIEATPDKVVLNVQDNGIGMTPDLLARVFELFAQAERSSDRTSGGLGIGLALVKSLVEKQGGTVACASEGLGHGSQFVVTLPRLPERVMPATEKTQDELKKFSSRTRRILIVDDNVDAAMMLAMYLENLGHHVMVEHTANMALKRALDERPEIMLLDIGLPEMNGNELARQLRLQTENVGSILIAVTGYGQEKDRVNSRKAGFDHHLVKPVDTKRLLEIFDDLD